MTIIAAEQVVPFELFRGIGPWDSGASGRGRKCYYGPSSIDTDTIETIDDQAAKSVDILQGGFCSGYAGIS